MTGRVMHLEEASTEMLQLSEITKQIQSPENITLLSLSIFFCRIDCAQLHFEHKDLKKLRSMKAKKPQLLSPKPSYTPASLQQKVVLYVLIETKYTVERNYLSMYSFGK